VIDGPVLISAILGLQLKYGISIHPGTGTVDGKVGDYVLLAPAYNITEKGVKLTVRVIEDFFRAFCLEIVMSEERVARRLTLVNVTPGVLHEP